MKKSKKTTLQQMYEVIIENGGPTGPISQGLVDAYEGRDYTKPYEFKRIIQFKKRGLDGKNNNWTFRERQSYF